MFLPFNMYPGHRGYGTVGGSQSILPANFLQQFMPVLNSLFGSIKQGSRMPMNKTASYKVGAKLNLALLKNPYVSHTALGLGALGLGAALRSLFSGSTSAVAPATVPVTAPAPTDVPPTPVAVVLDSAIAPTDLGEAIPNPVEVINTPFGAIPKDPRIWLQPLSYHPVLSGAILGGLLGSLYLTSKHRKKYKNIEERVFSPETAYGMVIGGVSGAALATALHNLMKLKNEQ